MTFDIGINLCSHQDPKMFPCDYSIPPPHASGNNWYDFYHYTIVSILHLKRKIIQCVIFCVRLPSFSMKPVRFFMLMCHWACSFLLLSGIPSHMDGMAYGTLYNNFFSHSLLDGHWGCFQLWRWWMKLLWTFKNK